MSSKVGRRRVGKQMGRRRSRRRRRSECAQSRSPKRACVGTPETCSVRAALHAHASHERGYDALRAHAVGLRRQLQQHVSPLFLRWPDRRAANPAWAAHRSDIRVHCWQPSTVGVASNTAWTAFKAVFPLPVLQRPQWRCAEPSRAAYAANTTFGCFERPERHRANAAGPADGFDKTRAGC